MKKPNLGRQDVSESAKPVLALLFGLSSIVVLELGNITISNFSFADTWFMLGDIAVSNAAGIAVAALATGYALSNRDMTDWTDTQSYVAYAVIGSVAVLAIAPTLRAEIVASQGASWLVFLLQLVGFGVVTEMHDFGMSTGRGKSGGWFR